MMRLSKPSFILRPLILALLFGISQTPQAQTPAVASPSSVQENGETVSLNFNNVDIDAVVRAIGKITGRNFILDPRVKGNLNIVTSRPVPRAMTYSILLSALRLQGYTVVESGNVAKVLPEADAKLHALPVDKGRNRQISGDRLVTEVFQIRHESAAQLVQVVRPLVSPNNTVSVYSGNNSLVITDYAENIARIARIIESIDVPQGDAQIIPIRNASAIDVANMLNKLFGESQAGTAAEPSMKVAILADSRSNALLVRTENRARLQAVRSMAAQLDQAGATSNIRVVFLKNANAGKVAQTLRAALGSNDAGGNAANSATNSAPGASTTTNTTASMTSTAGNFSQSSSTNSNSTGGVVFADTANNALIINGPDAVYNNLRSVIDELDRRPAQVYVEALIAEVTSDRAAEFGIQWQGGQTNNGTGVYAGTNFGSTSSGSNLLTLAAAAGSSSTTTTVTPGSGLNFIVGSGKSITIGGLKIADLNLLARFLETDTRANILSTPSLVTVDNEEAKIVVGKNVPFVTGQYTNTGSGSSVSNPFQTIERKDVGLTLKLKPQITEGGAIRLQIYQEASAVIDNSGSSANGPSTTKRSIESSVIADDGAIIAIGGLVEDSYSGGTDKVPFLGDLPLIGSLFRFDTRKRVKTNLIIFLRPRVLRTAEDSASLSNSRYDTIIGKQRTADATENLLRNEAPLPELPPKQ